MICLNAASSLLLLALLQQAVSSPVDTQLTGRSTFKASVTPSLSGPNPHTTPSSSSTPYVSASVVDSIPYNASKDGQTDNTTSWSPAPSSKKQVSTNTRSQSKGAGASTNRPSSNAEPSPSPPETQTPPSGTPTSSTEAQNSSSESHLGTSGAVPNSTNRPSGSIGSSTHRSSPNEGVSTRPSDVPSDSPSGAKTTSSEGSGTSQSSVAAEGETVSTIASPTVATEAFPTTFEAATTTIDKGQETSQAPAIGVMFGSLYADRLNLKNPKKKQEYIDDVDKTKSSTDDFFHSLEDQPDPPSGCSGKQKRSIGSFLESLAGDIPKLASCATKVVDDLSSKVKLPDPPESEINDLTDTLSKISDLMENPENQDPSSSASESSSSTSASSSECKSGTAVPQCTQTISLSTSYYSDITTSGSTVVTSMTSTCSTITTCDATATTEITTVATTASPTSTGTPELEDGKIMCAADCKVCESSKRSASSSSKRSDISNLPFSLAKRSLDDYTMSETILEYFEGQTGVTEDEGLTTGTIKVEHEGDKSTARVIRFTAETGRVFVEGLVGCTSVAIVSESGAWLSHHWEVPLFTIGDKFEDKVLNSIRSGDGDDMPGAFELGQDGGILHPSNNPQIYIMTPANPDDSASLLYEDEVNRLESLLSGDDSPWKGMEITRHVYAKPAQVDISEGREVEKKLNEAERENNKDEINKWSDQLSKENYKIVQKEEQVMKRYWNAPKAKGRVLIEFDPHQTQDPNSEFFEEEQTPAKAMWRIFMEDFSRFKQWCPHENQQTGRNQKRAVCSLDNGSSTTSTTSGASSKASSTGSSKTTNSNTTKTTSSSAKATTSFWCETYANPDNGEGVQCQCAGSDDKFPTMSSSSGMTSYQPCAYTALPTNIPTTTAPPFTATLTDGDVIRCESSSYYNYAVNTNAECAGSSTVISTITSIASAYSASVASHAASVSAVEASASWSTAAAEPSAACYITDDDGLGDSAFQIWGINGWAGDDGDSLYAQEKDCGWIDNWKWHTEQEVEFEGQKRDTQSASFSLSFFKGGCVERAVKSAGGPDITCHHGSGKRGLEVTRTLDEPIPRPSKRWKIW